MREEIILPIAISDVDHHCFLTMNRTMKLLKKCLKVREVGFSKGAYVGMIYSGSLGEPENELMLKELRKICDPDTMV